MRRGRAVDLLSVENHFSVHEHLLDSERLFLIRHSRADRRFVKHRDIGIVAFAQIPAFADHKAIGACAGHTIDRIGQRIAQPEQ